MFGEMNYNMVMEMLAFVALQTAGNGLFTYTTIIYNNNTNELMQETFTP